MKDLNSYQTIISGSGSSKAFSIDWAYEQLYFYVSNDVTYMRYYDLYSYKFQFFASEWFHIAIVADLSS